MRCRSILVARVAAIAAASRSDDRTHFLNGEQQLTIRFVLADQPSQNIAVEQAPVAARADISPMARADADQPFGCASFNGFADDATTDAEPDFEEAMFRGRASPTGIKSCTISLPSVVSTA